MQFDIFNGDADGIFALHQYRLKFGQDQRQLITGVKRDIKLLSKLDNVKDSNITVFDISLHSNIDALTALLGSNNTITYFDHHYAGDIPSSPLLHTHIKTSAETCTSLIINSFCDHHSPHWAICGAFGDNLHQAASDLAIVLQLSEKEVNILQELGELFNYNGYGSSLEDLHFDPAHLYQSITPYKNPFDFHSESMVLDTLRNGYNEDLTSALSQKPERLPGKNRVYIFPDEPWARRVTGVFSNLKARERAHAAHAILTLNNDSSLRISVRAPLADKRDADTLCNLFPTGGGRAAAAGINSLPADQYEKFIEKFSTFYSD